jgi:signal transduction histidine kinase
VTAEAEASPLVPLIASLNAALEALREITRGVFPAQLARAGLPAALASLLARTGTTQRLVVDRVRRRPTLRRARRGRGVLLRGRGVA